MSAWTGLLGTGAMREELWTARMVRRVRDGWAWVARREAVVKLQRKNRRLEVRETVSVGEKRFVSILRVDGRQFLIGSSAAGVQMLATLGEEAQETFGAAMDAARAKETA